MTLEMNYGIIVIFEIILGIGLGLIFPVTSTIVQNSVPTIDMANALSAFTFFQTMGAAIGVSILAAVLNSRQAARLSAGDDFVHATQAGLTELFETAIAPASILFIGSLFIKKVDLHLINPAAGEMGALPEPQKETPPIAGDKDPQPTSDKAEKVPDKSTVSTPADSQAEPVANGSGDTTPPSRNSSNETPAAVAPASIAPAAVAIEVRDA